MGFEKPIEYFYIIAYAIMSLHPPLLQIGLYDSARGTVSTTHAGVQELRRLKSQSTKQFKLRVPPVLLPIMDECKTVPDEVVAGAMEDAYWGAQVRSQIRAWFKLESCLGKEISSACNFKVAKSYCI